MISVNNDKSSLTLPPLPKILVNMFMPMKAQCVFTQEHKTATDLKMH